VTQAAYRVHRLIQDLNRDQHIAKAFAIDPEALFNEYGLEANERACLREGTPKALMKLGVHPNLQMKFIKLKTGLAKAGAGGLKGPLDAYLRDLGRP
jgi:hypothetical protein